MKMVENGLLKFKILNKSSKLILMNNFLIPLVTFGIIPFLPVIIHQSFSIPYGVVWFYIAIMLFINYSGSFLIGLFLTSLSTKKVMIFALSLRGVGIFLLFLGLYDIKLPLLAILFLSFGSAFYMTASKTYLTQSVNKDSQALFLSLSNACLNAGMAIGPVISSVFILKYTYSYLMCAFIAIVIVIILHIFLPEVSVVYKKNGSLKRVINELFCIMRQYPYLFICIITTYYLFFFFQNYAVPYFAKNQLHYAIGLLLALNSITVVILQPMLSSWIKEKYFFTIISLSFLMLAIGFLFIASIHLFFIICGVFIISLGEVFLFLKVELQALKYFPKQPSIAFGYVRLCAGIGVAMNSIIGGKIFTHYNEISRLSIFWYIITLKCILFALFFFFFFRHKKVK